ncbi:DUF805 domain-containing protein [Gemella sp. GH3]|uniref:DUF805 domain-containing protein n=1 Tax=unclassified Gemella TaxID=2624949 RepID=UPI0015D06C50|nr:MULTISPECIES: DUF805 domain-containing protein [unclassified Gemella]MBF0713600.1 DUF805 domain-containing protein [Gemella sp. GH3.1]NYS50552.1 DUF805 domain-containing protein [Gemella sp. GH3]
MIDQRNKEITYKQSISDYFNGYVNFYGYTSRRGFWMPTGTIIALAFILIIIFLGDFIYTVYNTSFWAPDYVSKLLRSSLIGLLILMVFSFTLFLPSLTLLFRRLRDVGLSNWGIGVSIIGYLIINSTPFTLLATAYSIGLFIVLPSLNSNMLVTNKTDSFSQFFFRKASKEVVSEVRQENTTIQSEEEISNQLENVGSIDNNAQEDSNNTNQ